MQYVRKEESELIDVDMDNGNSNARLATSCLGNLARVTSVLCPVIPICEMGTAVMVLRSLESCEDEMS